MRKILPLMTTLLAVAAPIGAVAATPAVSAIYLHGQVYTPSGWQQAIAVGGDGRIVAVGSDAQIQTLAGSATTRVDLAGKTLMPGLHDMHVHPLGGGLTHMQCTFAQGSDRAQIVAFVKGCVAHAKPGAWIVGGQWQAISFGQASPTKAMLDAIAPANPVLLYDISGHSAWVNSAALKSAGITSATRPPASGGVIEHDSNGDPTGILRENATALVGDKIPPATPDITLKALDIGLSTLLSFGVTELVDAMIGKDLLDAYDTLSDNGRLVQRVRGCIVYGKELGKGVAFEQVLQARAQYARPHLKTDCVKVFMDGVPTESHTAAMIEPYAAGAGSVDQDPARQRGLLLLQPAELDPLIARLDAMGITVKFHSVGDRASQIALDSIEKARRINGAGPYHTLGHLTFITPADLRRAAALGVALEFSPYLWFPQPIDDDIIKAIGPDRIERVWPLREGIDAGALVVAGSDWEVVPSANPWIGIEALVTRKAPGGVRAGESFGPKEAITLKEAIDIFTINAAKQMGDDDVLGSIEPGKIADFILLDRNPFKIAITDVHNVKVTEVVIAGKTVFAASAANAAS